MNMAEEKRVDEQVRDLLDSWNPAPTDWGVTQAIGDVVPEGDTRATVAFRDPRLDHPRNPALDSLDAGLMFADDGEDDEDGDDEDDDVDERIAYSDMTKKELQSVIDSRNADRDEDDHLSKSGNKAELAARLEEDDESEGESEDEDDESDDE